MTWFKVRKSQECIDISMFHGFKKINHHRAMNSTHSVYEHPYCAPSRHSSFVWLWPTRVYEYLGTFQYWLHGSDYDGDGDGDGNHVFLFLFSNNFFLFMAGWIIVKKKTLVAVCFAHRKYTQCAERNMETNQPTKSSPTKKERHTAPTYLPTLL